MGPSAAAVIPTPRPLVQDWGTYTDEQQRFLDRTGIVETWITSFSTAMCDVLDGTDVYGTLARTLVLLLGLLGLGITILALFSQPYRQLSTRYAAEPEPVLTS